MPYTPSRPTTVETLQELADWVERELTAISKESLETTALELRPINVEPLRPREGMIVYADGTNFDPGSGEGPYVYNGTAWVFLA